ncbi:MAG: diguanylate cyclase [Clostridiales bacterium]|nr:diguanylate cyclase [Clostridiales bacterium]
MKETFGKKIRILKKKLTNENERIRLQFVCVYILFSIVSFSMSLINVFTGWRSLMIYTLIFGVMNVINTLLSIKPSKLEHAARILFAGEMIWLFTSFTIFGEPEGFSTIWIALLPSCGLLLYRKKAGTALSLVMLAVLIFLFWTPIGRSLLQYDYTASFMLRFPVLYIAFYGVGFFFELIRGLTQEELNLSKDKYVKLSYTDQLTGLGNESSYLRTINRIEKNIQNGNARFSVVFMDVNCVKATNDKYGHRFGCYLIVTAGKLLPRIFTNADIFHVGGDEFVAIIQGDDCDKIDEYFEEFDRQLSYKIIQYESTDLVLSVAKGCSDYKRGDKYINVMQRADNNMYRNKRDMKKKYAIEIR